MKSSYMDGVRMQKSIAMGGQPPSGNFGVEDMQSKAIPHPDRKRKTKQLADSERAQPPAGHGGPGRPAEGAMRGDREVDHGPYDEDMK